MKISKTYELERTTHNECAYHQYQLDLEANYTRGRPGNYNNPPEGPELEISRCTCGGEPFELTDAEYETIVDGWLEEDPEPDYEPMEYEDYDK